MSDSAFKKLDSLIMAITKNACGNGSAEDVSEKREALESHIHGMQSRLDLLEKENASLKQDAARWREVLTNDEFVVCDGEMNEYFKSKIEAIIDEAHNITNTTKE